MSRSKSQHNTLTIQTIYKLKVKVKTTIYNCYIQSIQWAMYYYKECKYFRIACTIIIHV